jgi:cellulose synthase/poly-beta-1,6-N-acetylglucosamine synthase-like glycosyltransferase
MLILAIVFWVSVAAIVYSYVGYLVIVGVLARLFGRPWSRSDASLPTVAFVVPVYNEELVIENKLRNILALDYPGDKLTIWVGSDCSTDRTHELVQRSGDARVHLWVAPVRGGKTQVINLLTPTIQGAEVVVLTDANTRHDVGSVRALVRSFADPRVGAVAGQIEHAATGSDASEERMYRGFESRLKEAEALLHSCTSAYGGFYAIRRELFRPIPANAYSNDDVLIPAGIVRQGSRVVFDHEAVSREELAGDPRKEFSRRVRIGAGNFQALGWMLDFVNPLRGWPAFCFASHKLMRWISPLVLLTAFFSGAALYVRGWTPVALYGGVFWIGVVTLALTALATVVPVRPLLGVRYFVAMNVALLFGLARYAGGIHSAAWSPTDRGAAGSPPPV